MQALWILKQPVYKFAIYYTASRVPKLFLSHRMIFQAFFFFSYLCTTAKMAKMLQLPVFNRDTFIILLPMLNMIFLCYHPNRDPVLGPDFARCENAGKQPVKGSGLTYMYNHALVNVKLVQCF